MTQTANTVWMVFEDWSHDNIGDSHFIFSNKEAAVQCMHELIALDNRHGVTRYLAEEPEEWDVDEMERYYDAREINGDKWITIVVEEMPVKDYASDVDFSKLTYYDR